MRAAESGGDVERAYWASLWPASVSLARYLAGSALVQPGMRVLEIGCGLGVAGIVAARRGASVTLTDYSNEAVAAARRNAALNNVDVAASTYNWRDEPDAAWRPELLIGADVLYSPHAHEPIAALIARLDCVAVLTYPARPASANVIGVFERHGLHVWHTHTEQGRMLLAQRA